MKKKCAKPTITLDGVAYVVTYGGDFRRVCDLVAERVAEVATLADVVTIIVQRPSELRSALRVVAASLVDADEVAHAAVRQVADHVHHCSGCEGCRL